MTESRILYVEDDDDIRLIVEFALVQLGGFTVKACASGGEAVDSLPGFGPDLVLLDVMMPGMDGFETYRALRGLTGGEAVPVVFMTARVQAGEIEQCLALGAVGVIAKPFDPFLLAAEVTKHLSPQAL